MDYSRLALPKPTPRRILKARKKRQESVVIRLTRASCVLRDGRCRLAGVPGFSCAGVPEWAHLGDTKRARTRGMKPEIRHMTAGSLMLCTTHHEDYDKGRMRIDALTKDGANGGLAFVLRKNSFTYIERL
jgi:hypothetical protein